MIGRRKHKLYFEKTVSKFPIIIFIVSVLIGGFFLFRIIATLVKENDSTVELIPVETNIDSIKTKTVPPKEIASKPTSTSKSSVNKPTEKPTGAVQTGQTQPVVSSEFYTVQVATFKDKKSMEDLIKQLKAKNLSPLYIKPREHFLQVCVGKFESSAKGNGTLAKLKKDFPDAFTRKLQPPFEER